MSETTEERMAARKKAEDDLRANLAELQLDGPHRLAAGGGFDPISLLFGEPRTRYCICLRCGAMVVLDDAETLDDGRVIERSVRLHTAWHEQVKTR